MKPTNCSAIPSWPNQKITIHTDGSFINKPTITTHIDGSCISSAGHGGWSYILQDYSNGILVQETVKSVHLDQATNNVAELLPAIHALDTCPSGVPIELITDSQYLQKGCMEWLEGWKAKGWRKGNGKPIAHKKLWMKLDELLTEKTPEVIWVRAHCGNELNEKADHLAKDAAELGITVDETTYFDLEGNITDTPETPQAEQEQL